MASSSVITRSSASCQKGCSVYSAHTYLGATLSTLACIFTRKPSSLVNYAVSTSLTDPRVSLKLTHHVTSTRRSAAEIPLRLHWRHTKSEKVRTTYCSDSPLHKRHIDISLFFSPYHLCLFVSVSLGAMKGLLATVSTCSRCYIRLLHEKLWIIPVYPGSSCHNNMY